MQGQNARLLAQITAREEAQAGLAAERTKVGAGLAAEGEMGCMENEV